MNKLTRDQKNDVSRYKEYIDKSNNNEEVEFFRKGLDYITGLRSGRNVNHYERIKVKAVAGSLKEKYYIKHIEKECGLPYGSINHIFNAHIFRSKKWCNYVRNKLENINTNNLTRKNNDKT